MRIDWHLTPMAKLVVFGASGGTGRPFVEQALAAGHSVTAFVRDAATAPAGARVVAGDVLDGSAVDAAVAGHDVIVSALGHRRRARNPWSRDFSPPDLMTRATPHLIDAARRHGIARVLFVGVHGCGDSRARTSFIYRYLVERTTIGIALRDFNIMEGMLAESGLDWLVARPVSLVDGAARGRCQVRDDRISSLATIRRADVAAFMLAHVDGPIAARTPSIA
ncbi:MAG: Flavin reductase [bacterium]|nr:Flavin reductase [bacterium]